MGVARPRFCISCNQANIKQNVCITALQLRNGIVTTTSIEVLRNNN